VRLLSAEITNFRLLREVSLEFSTNRDRALTVIRAENASGKTSTLKALKWGLFGSKDGLDSVGERLSPIDWPDKTPCELRVRIDFEHTLPVQIDASTIREDTQKYTLIRKAVEEPTDGTFTRSSDKTELLHHTPAGAEPVAGAEARLREIIPADMRNIFFTDGDAALTFISADAGRTTKIDQVKNAIRSLLGLGLLEDVESALKHARSRLLRRQRDDAPAGELAKVTQSLQEKEMQRDGLQSDLTQARTRTVDLERRLTEAEKELTRALSLGNFDELANQRERVSLDLKARAQQESQLIREHTSLLKGKELSWGLIGPELSRGLDLLRQLVDKGIIPKASLPILRDRLADGRCICGAALTPGSDARKHVEQLLENEKLADEHSRLLTLLYHTADADSDDARSEGRQFLYISEGLRRKRADNLRATEDLERQRKELEQKISDINAVDIQSKTMARDTAKSSLKNQERRITEIEIALRSLEPEIEALNTKQRELRRHSQKLRALNAQITATEDLSTVVQHTLEDMQHIYLRRVSDQMNVLFMDMIGADPSSGSVYQSAEITSEYEIVVNSVDGRRLSPDHEVNGAAQRALTFAFIWALTEVSGVSAPRVIDTPLGMMAGTVKRRVLELIAEPPQSANSAQQADHQVVLLLTQSEIADTEDILDLRVGSSISYSNTEHFPRDLVNEPATRQPMIITCKCSHRQYCELCERRSRAHYHLVART